MNQVDRLTEIIRDLGNWRGMTAPELANAIADSGFLWDVSQEAVEAYINA